MRGTSREARLAQQTLGGSSSEMPSASVMPRVWALLVRGSSSSQGSFLMTTLATLPRAHQPRSFCPAPNLA
jgi:hypothetical protein